MESAFILVCFYQFRTYRTSKHPDRDLSHKQFADQIWFIRQETWLPF